MRCKKDLLSLKGIIAKEINKIGLNESLCVHISLKLLNAEKIALGLCLQQKILNQNN